MYCVLTMDVKSETAGFRPFETANNHLMFCQRQKRKNEVLPPTSDSFRHHYARQLPNIYLEKLAGSNARSAESRTPWIGERRLLSETGQYDEGYYST